MFPLVLMFLNTEMVLSTMLDEINSCFPSPSRSPAAMAKVMTPVCISIRGAKSIEAVPVFRKIEMEAGDPVVL